MFGLAMVAQLLSAQSEAAINQLRARYTAEQLTELQERSHFKYVGLLLYYSASFQVVDNGHHRAPSEAEIAQIDLHAYDALRHATNDVTVMDPQLGTPVLLFSRARFETLLLGELDATDRAHYMAQKAGKEQPTTNKTQ